MRDVIVISFCLSVSCIGGSLASAAYIESKIGAGNISLASDLKKECESSGNECVMVFDFVPVKKERSE